MKTKEQILDECHHRFSDGEWDLTVDGKFSVAYKTQALQAMEEYAQQQVTAFMNWTLGGDCNYMCTDEDQWTMHIDNPLESITTEQLYENFTEYQKTIQP